MNTRLRDNERIKSASLYITAAALCIVILCVFLQIWRTDLRLPFYYIGDATFYAMSTKGIVENGWYWQNPSLGAPGIQQMYDFPTFDNAVVLLTLLISRFTSNPFLVMNLFFLLSFPLVTIASLYVLRQFNISYLPALFSSLLYAFLPYHFMRNTSYLVLAAYYVIPPAVMIALWLMREELAPRTKKFVISVMICLLLGSSGAYYPFFFCFLLLVAGIAGALKMRSLRPLATAIVFTVITTATVAVNLSPSVIYKYRHSDAGVMVRGPAEAEKYALKITNLVLPVTGHRLGLFDRVKSFHNANSTVSDDDASSLGLVATVGFLGLLLQLMRRKELVNAGDVLHDLSVLNIFSILLGTIGGFGLLFALYVSTGIRSYNRISVCIAFFSLMAVAIGLDSIYRRTARTRGIFYVVLAVIFVAAFLDQTTSAYVPKYEKTKAEFFNDRQFINQIEASVPPGAMIFQLPYIPFPEHPRVNKMADYDHLRGYLHSKTIRWSYGAIKNRDVDQAQRSVASLPPAELAQTLAVAGFSGIYVDRFGYEDNGAALESELTKVLQTTPSISANGRLVFFNLVDYANRLRQKYSSSDWERQKELSFQPVLLNWEGGFSDLETGPEKTWRWCSSEGVLRLKNTSQQPRTVKIEMSFATGYDQLADFSISGLLSEQLKVNDKPHFYSKTLTIPPGESTITFRSAARRVNAPSDTRFLVFRIEDFKMTELNSQPD